MHKVVILVLFYTSLMHTAYYNKNGVVMYKGKPHCWVSKERRKHWQECSLQEKNAARVVLPYVLSSIEANLDDDLKMLAEATDQKYEHLRYENEENDPRNAIQDFLILFPGKKCRVWAQSIAKKYQAYKSYCY